MLTLTMTAHNAKIMAEIMHRIFFFGGYDVSSYLYCMFIST